MPKSGEYSRNSQVDNSASNTPEGGRPRSRSGTNRSISLVVATRNRPRELVRLLDSLRKQHYAFFDAVVVDQSEPTIARANAERIQEVFSDLPIRHVITETRGLSRARNIGLDIVKGEIVGFPDDDCWYHECLLDQVASSFEENPGIAFVSGQYSEPGVVNPSFSPDPRTLTSPASGFDCSSVTFFLDRSLVESLEMRFDESIGAGTDLPAGEESDFLIRLMSSGATGVYLPDLVIYHPVDRRPDLDDRLAARYEEAYGYVLGKNAKIQGIGIRMLAGLAKLIVDSILRRKGYARLGPRLRGIRIGLRSRS